MRWKKARTYKNFQLYFWIILELKTIERRSLYLRHSGMSPNSDFKVLERLPDFLIPKIKSRRLCSETFLCTEKIKSTTGQFDPKSLLNLNKFSTIGWTISRAFLSYKNYCYGDFQSEARGQGVDPTHTVNCGYLTHDTHGMWWLLEKTNICVEKKPGLIKTFSYTFELFWN